MTGRLIHQVTGEVFELADRSEIGRSPRAAVVISDPRVSRKHAVIHRQGDGFWFYDQGSVNGTSINGNRATVAQRLVSGAILRIADDEFRFECPEAASGRTQDSICERTIMDVRQVDAIILVSDIQGFTRLSERLPPDEQAPFIGAWYERTEQILELHHAQLDKFLGDCVFAYWLDTSVETRRAAVAIQQACQEVGLQHRAILDRENLSFKSGAALHIGPTAYGPIRANDFTLLGDTVNVTFRLEKLTRSVGASVVASGEFLTGWDEGRRFFRSLGEHAPKGRDKAIEVHGLVERES